MPDFQSLPLEEKRKYVTSKYPDFSLLPPLEQNKLFEPKPTFGKMLTALPTALRELYKPYLKDQADIAIGYGRGAASTLRGAGQLATLGGERNLTPGQRAFLDRVTTATNAKQEAGKFQEQMLEAALVPGGMAKNARLLTRMGAGALSGGGIAGLQSGFKPGETLTAAGAGAALPVVGAALAPPLRAAGRAAVRTLSKWTGASPEGILTAVSHASDRFKAAKNGGKDEVQVVGDFRDLAQKLATKKHAEYRAKLPTLPNVNLQDVVESSEKDLMKSLADHRVGVSREKIPHPQGFRDNNDKPIMVDGPLKLDFSKSTITHAPDQAKLQDLVHDIDTWKDFGTLDVDALKRRVDSYYADTAAGHDIVQATKENLRGGLNRKVKGYQDMTSEYAIASEFLDNYKKEFSLEAADGTAVRKIVRMLNQNNQYRKLLLDSLGQAGQDLKEEVAGLEFRQDMPHGFARIGSRIFQGGLLGASAAASHFGGVPWWETAPVAGALFMAQDLASSPHSVGTILALISDMRRNPAIRAALSGAGRTGRAATIEGGRQLGQ